MSKREITYKVENVVASVSLDDRIDLNKLSNNISEAEYDPSQFPGLVLRLKDPKAAILVFNTGRMVVTGLRSEEDAPKVVARVIEKIKTAGIDIRSEPKIQIQNIVASGNLGARLDLEVASLTLEDALYEPEQFPGLIYRAKDPKVVFLLFCSGRIVCTGAKKETNVQEAVNKLDKMLTELEIYA
ncbi:MAG: TATA-box-binding protein [Candidatus Odinarchaeota archaeon]